MKKFLFKNFCSAIKENVNNKNTKRGSLLNVSSSNLKDLISYSKKLIKHITPLKSSQIHYDDNKYSLSFNLSRQLSNSIIADASKFLIEPSSNINIDISETDSSLLKTKQVSVLSSGQNINRVISLKLGKNTKISIIQEFSNYLEKVINLFNFFI